MKHRAIIQNASLVFSLAFAFNFVWEQLHSTLYVHFKAGPITQYVLLRATFIDAVLITGFFLIISLIPLFNKRPLIWLAIFGLAAAVGIERYALATDRWAYSEQMPIIPVLLTGLTPTIQLMLLGILSVMIAKSLLSVDKLNFLLK